MIIFGIKEFSGGLNNQKMALAGCFILAREVGGKVKLPKYIANFSPTKNGYIKDPLLFSDAFNEDIIVNSIPSALLADPGEQVTDWLSWKTCFEAGGRSLDRLDNLAVSIVVNLVPCPALQNIADSITKWLAGINSFALQLRIERDWQEYLIKKFGGLDLLLDDQEITVNIDRIFQKCSNTSDLYELNNIYCCCDEDDLLLDKNFIKTRASQFGFSVYFKTDFPPCISLPVERMKRSIIDFSVCMGLDAYVGLTRSTFSNQLFLAKKNGQCKSLSRHFIYNNIGNSLLLRS